MDKSIFGVNLLNFFVIFQRVFRISLILIQISHQSVIFRFIRIKIYQLVNLFKGFVHLLVLNIQLLFGDGNLLVYPGFFLQRIVGVNGFIHFAGACKQGGFHKKKFQIFRLLLQQLVVDLSRLIVFSGLLQNIGKQQFIPFIVSVQIDGFFEQQSGAGEVIILSLNGCQFI